MQRRCIIICVALVFAVHIADAQTITTRIPLAGEITLEKQKEGVYQAPIEDKGVGPLQLSEGIARKTPEGKFVEYRNGTFLGNEFEVAFNQERAPLSAEISRKKVYVGEVTPKNGDVLSIAGITIRDAQIVFDKVSKEFMVEGRFREFNLDFIAIFKVEAETKKVEFGLQLETIPDRVCPFTEIVPKAPKSIKDICLKNVRAGVQGGVTISTDGAEVQTSENTDPQNNQGDTQQDSSQDKTQQNGYDSRSRYSKKRKDKNPAELSGTIFISGTVTNIPFIEEDITAYLGFTVGTEELVGATLYIGLPDGWALSNLIPDEVDADQTFKDVLDVIKLKNAEMSATTQEQISLGDVTFERGLSVYGAIGTPEKGKNKITDALRQIFNDVGIVDPELTIYGGINPVEGDVKVESMVGFPELSFEIGNMKFGGWQVGFNLEANATKGTVTVGYVGEGNLTPPQQDTPLIFSGGVKIQTPSQVGGFLTMKHAWKDPLGIKGVKISDLSVSGKQSIAQTVATGGAKALIPSELGMTGKASIDFTPEETSKGTFTLQAGTDPTAWAFDIDIEDPPNLPETAAFIFKQLGGEASKISIDKIVPIEINRARFHFTPFPTDIGTIQLEQGVGYNLDATVLGHNAKLYAGASLGDLGIKYNGSMDPLHIGPIHITGAEGEGKPNFDFDLNLKNQNAILNGNIRIGDIDDPILQSETEFNLSLDGLSFQFDNRIGPFTACVFGKTEMVNKLPEDFTLIIDFKQEILTYLQDMSSALAKISKELSNAGMTGKQPLATKKIDPNFLQKKANAIEDKKKSLEQRWQKKKEPVEKDIQSIEEKLKELRKRKREAGSGRWGRGGYEADIENYEKQKQNRKEELEKMRQQHRKVVNREVQEFFSDIFAGASDIVLDISKEIAEPILTEFSIDRIYFNGNASDLFKGELPTVAVWATIAGQKKCSEFQFDFKNPEKSAKNIATGVMNLATGAGSEGGMCKNPPELVC